MKSVGRFVWKRFNLIKRVSTILALIGLCGSLLSLGLWWWCGFPMSSPPPIHWSLEWFVKFLFLGTSQLFLIPSYLLARMYQVYLEGGEGPKLNLRHFLRSWDIQLSHEYLAQLELEYKKARLAEQMAERRLQRSIGTAKRAMDQELNRLLDRFPTDSHEWKLVASALDDSVSVETKAGVIEAVTPQIPMADLEQQRRKDKIAELCERLKRLTPDMAQAETEKVCADALELMQTNYKTARSQLVAAITKRRRLNSQSPEFAGLNEI